jgi:hypothetical protein
MRTTPKCVLATMVAAVYVALLLGCSGSSIVTREWTEDVLLDDGKVIEVKRTVRFKESNSLSGDAYNAVEHDATIAFTGDLGQLRMWQEPLMALALYHDRATNEWVIVATTTSCQTWNERGKPKPPYWEFRLSQAGWQQTPLAPASLGRPANLLRRYQKELKSEHITTAERKRIESDGMDRIYREIWGDPTQYFCGEALGVGEEKQ